MHSAPAQTGAGADQNTTPHAAAAPPHVPPHIPPQPPGATPPSVPQNQPPGPPPAAPGLPYPPDPALRHRRDGILPNVAAALTVQGTTLTGTAARGDRPPALHGIVQDFLDALPGTARDRFTGRCAETLLVSRHLDAADENRSKRAKRKPMSQSEARKALKNATLTARRLREDGDPLHGTVARPCRACTALADHFGVRIAAPATGDD